jgi:FKBP-type peptidyl-prolyl cis-trans isomerase FkpA
MKMRLKPFLQLALILAAATFVSSCLDIGNDIEEKPSEAKEMQLLQTYLDSLLAQGHDIDTTELGVYYVTIEEGEGEFAQPGDTLTVGYAGYFVDGFLFDSTDIHSEDGKMEFVLEDPEEPPYIPGWDDGMKVMKKGSKIQMIIPSELAYGSEGQGIIPPYETLIFVVKMFEIKSP